MKYLCEVHVTVTAEVAFDAELNVIAEFEDGQLLAERYDMPSFSDISLSGQVELEIEAENEEEAERIAIEQVEDESKWEVKSYVIGQNVFSTYVKEATVDSIEVTSEG
ncbi:MAG: hypothetical protein DRO05_00640 [Thermoproteota archaeon]|nr:MAG: hypothetical protein DRO05_00640 [Candidatus Korarchaeota archaeon]